MTNILKFFVFILLTLIFLTACGGDETPTPSVAPPDPTADESTEDSEAATAVPPTEEPTEATPETEAEMTDAMATFEPLETCFVEMPEDVEFECGTVTVPEFYGEDNGRTITIGVIRLLTNADSPAEPMFFASGGPGSSLIDSVPLVAAAALEDETAPYAQLLADRDLVFFTQRGTAYADPELVCDFETFDKSIDLLLDGSTAAEREQEEVQAIQGCMTDFADDGVDFTAYNSVQSAADVNAIRQALGYDQLLFYGESYGTLLGQHVMRDFPETLTAVILDGTAPISPPSWVTQLDAKYQHSLDVVVGLCAVDEACNAAYPSLAEDVEALYQKLQTEPYSFEYAGVPVQIDENLAASAIYDSFYTPLAVSYLPLTIQSMLNDTVDERVNIVLNDVASFSPGFSFPTHYAIICSEDPITSLDDALSLDDLSYSFISEFLRADTYEYTEMCEFLGLPVLPDDTDTPISSELPVLVLSGAFDPITPAFTAETILDTLPNSYAFEFPYRGHVQFITDNACAASIVMDFIADPTTEPDSNCIAEMEPLEFELPAEQSEQPVFGEGIYWQWSAFIDPVNGETAIDDPAPYTLTVTDEISVLSGACRVAVASEQEVTESTLTLTYDLPDKLDEACEDPPNETRFFELMQGTGNYYLKNGRLFIDLMADAGTMVFIPYDPIAAAQEALRVESWDEVLTNVLAAPACPAPGGVLLVDTPQGRFLKAEGVASTEDGTPLTVADTFEIGSNTKSFTTVLALLLQEEGVWSLDDLLQTYLPEQAAKLTYGDEVTLRQLAQNHSGIPDYADPIIGNSILNNDFEHGYTPEELVDYAVENLETSFEPGQDWQYSTTNFILLGMAIEAVTGQSLADLYQVRIFDPLEMTNSFLLEGVPEEGQIVDGYYTLDDGEVINVTTWNGSQGWAGGGNVSTAEDMAKYAAGIASGALFQDPASLEQLLDFGDGFVGSFGGYGLGIGRWYEDPEVWGHGGQTPGFQTMWGVYPEQESRVIFLTNSGSCNVASVVLPIMNASPDLFTQEMP